MIYCNKQRGTIFLPNSKMPAFYILMAAWIISSGVYGFVAQTHNLTVTTFETGLCDCDYHPHGCAISKKAPPNWACHCKYKLGWTCGGTMAKCLDPNSYYCKNPDTSVQSCVIGGGDCKGYAFETCDCDHHSGGCTISKVPPHDTACHCFYKWFLTCGGSITQCKSFSNYFCKIPDRSIYTCNQGSGDCGGY